MTPDREAEIAEELARRLFPLSLQRRAELRELLTPAPRTYSAPGDFRRYW